tara:strand:+ start:1252 stop:1614 length:363 start_codon:yes stop_codon:yes gene_type:complete
MSYIEGFVIPVPKRNLQAYLEVAKRAAPVFLEYGALRVVETWADDIKPGKTNDFRTAVLAEAEEDVVFSWIEWPSKQVRDAGNEKAMTDSRMQIEGGEYPFSGARLIYGGFAPILDVSAK